MLDMTVRPSLPCGVTAQHPWGSPVFAFRNFSHRQSSEPGWGAAAGERVKKGLLMQVQVWPNWSHDAKQHNEAESGAAKSSDPMSAN